MYRHCNGCSVGFSISHALDCKKGGIVTSLHNELRERGADLSSKSLTPTNMLNDLLTHACCAVKIMRSPLVGPHLPNNPHVSAVESKHKGGLLIWYILENGTD